jgi:hypothetical protein
VSVHAKLDDSLIDKITALEPIPVIISFGALPPTEDLESLGVEVTHVFAGIDAVSARCTGFALGRVVDRSDVIRVEYDGEIRVAEPRRRNPTIV